MLQETLNFYKAHAGLYIITGTLKNGRRFKPIYTSTPQHYNIWKGTIYFINPDGRRKVIKRYY